MPIIDPAKEPFPSFGEIVTRTTYGSSGEVKQALTDLRDIGKFVARIIADKRTLNRYVLVHSEEHTQNEIFALAKRVSGSARMYTVGQSKPRRKACSRSHGHEPSKGR